MQEPLELLRTWPLSGEGAELERIRYVEPVLIDARCCICKVLYFVICRVIIYVKKKREHHRDECYIMKMSTKL